MNVGSRNTSQNACEARSPRSRPRSAWPAALLTAATILLPSLPARAGDPAPDGRALCVAKHESAQISRNDGKLRAARAALLTCSNAACPAAIRSDCGEWLEEVERSLPTVVIAARSPKGDESAGRVLIDGEVVATHLDGRPLEVDPGAHVFRVEVPPYDPVEQKLVIHTGEKNREVPVTLGQPAATTLPLGGTPPPIEEHRPVPVAAYALGGVTVAGLAAFAALGGSGLTMRSSLRSSCAPFCTDAQIQPVRTRFLAADISLGVAAASAAAAIVVFVRRPAVPRTASSTTRAALWPRPRIASLLLSPTASGVIFGLHGEQ